MMKTTLLFIFFVVVASWVEGKRCPRTNAQAYRYCTVACSTTKDCKGNEKCLCDRDCGLSCVKNDVNCGRPPKPKNSRRPQMTRGSSFNSTVTYKCKTNYKLRGSKKRVCRAIGKWDGKNARCRLFCPTLKDMRYGNSRADTKGLQVTFWCWQGYRLQGHRVLTCQSSGNWDHPQPKCSPPTCGPVQVPNNADIQYPRQIPKVYSFGARVQFACKTGYFRQGIAVQQCNQNGWTKSSFSCIPKTCGDPGTPLNGKKDGYQYTFKSRVSYQCNLGYRLSGSAYRNCQANQRWSGETPKCRAVDCGPLRPPVHGETLDETKTTYQGRITFRCTDKGYEMKGSRQRTCQANGQWNGEETKCEIIRCDVPEIPKNGRHIVSKGYFYGGFVRFECNPNYIISSSAIVYCQENKRWSGKSPYCSAPCRDPGVPKNAHRLQNDFRHDKKVAFRCVGQDYVKKGSSEIKCSDGRWDTNPPKCYAPCPKPSAPANGQWYGSDFRHEKRVDFRCNSGYQIIGTSSATCNDGKWNNDPPVCKGICRDPGRPRNGLIVKSKRQYLQGDEVEFQCRSGYDLFGKIRLYCQNRNWDDARPSCRGRCRDRGSPRHGSVKNETLKIGNQFRHGGEIKYKCNARYTMVGDVTLRCSDGGWSNSVPLCKARCSQPDALTNGRVVGNDFTHGKIIAFVCNSGYKVDGASSATCTDGRWSDNPPVCRASCPEPNDPRHGGKRGNDFSHGGTVRFVCNVGYGISGAQSVTCNDGIWNKQLPLCKGACPSLGSLQDGSRSPDKPKYVDGDDVEFSCSQDFDLLGTKKIHCQGIKWNGSKPNCMQRCDRPGLPRYGGIAYERHKKTGNKFAHEKGEIRFNCGTNHNIVGNPIIRCNNGRWTVKPVCKAACGKPPSVTHRLMRGSGFRHGNSVSFSCTGAGYNLTGPGTITCQDGQWKPKPPVCKVLCSQPNAPQKGWVDGKDFSHGANVVFVCASGYKVVGASSATCENGSWTHNTPVCRVFCGDPGTPQNGFRLSKLNAYEGGNVSFRCDSNFKLFGTSDLFCRSGKWSGPLPVCKKNCASPGRLTRGLTTRSKILTGAVFRDGQSIQYKCETKFVMEGNATLECNSGSWSSSVPQCKAPCRKPGNITNGQRFGNDFHHGQSVTYNCNVNYTLEGKQQLNCTDGTWGGSPPTCKVDKSTALAFRCNFDSSDCGFKQSKNDDFDWTRHQGRTVSDNTGPSADAGGSGHYMYIEASRKGRGSRARLVKSGLRLNRGQCLSFYYHMFGTDVGTLKVLVGQTEVFSAQGSKGNKWNQKIVQIVAASDTLAFEAAIDYWSSDIAIDDISIYACSA